MQQISRLLLYVVMLCLVITLTSSCMERSSTEWGQLVGEHAFLDYTSLTAYEREHLFNSTKNPPFTSDGRMLRVYVSRANCNKVNSDRGGRNRGQSNSKSSNSSIDSTVLLSFTLGKTNFRYPISRFYSDNQKKLPLSILRSGNSYCVMTSTPQPRYFDVFGGIRSVNLDQQSNAYVPERNHPLPKQAELKQGEFEKTVDFDKRVAEKNAEYDKLRNNIEELRKQPFYKANIYSIGPPIEHDKPTSLVYNPDREQWEWTVLDDDETLYLDGVPFYSAFKSTVDDTKFESFYCGDKQCDFSLQFPQPIEEAKKARPELHLVVVFSADEIDSYSSVTHFCDDSRGCIRTTTVFRANVAYAAFFINKKMVRLIYESPQNWYGFKDKAINFIGDSIDYNKIENANIPIVESFLDVLATG